METPQVETKVPSDEALLGQWKAKLEGKNVEVNIGGTDIKGHVERVMVAGGFPKYIIAIIKPQVGPSRSVYDLESIKMVE